MKALSQNILSVVSEPRLKEHSTGDKVSVFWFEVELRDLVARDFIDVSGLSTWAIYLGIKSTMM